MHTEQVVLLQGVPKREGWRVLARHEGLPLGFSPKVLLLFLL